MSDPASDVVDDASLHRFVSTTRPERSRLVPRARKWLKGHPEAASGVTIDWAAPLP